ncbi:MAG: hypothetical protein R3B96_19400 [Pirellulaceae bacterium]
MAIRVRMFLVFGRGVSIIMSRAVGLKYITPAALNATITTPV